MEIEVSFKMKQRFSILVSGLKRFAIIRVRHFNCKLDIIRLPLFVGYCCFHIAIPKVSKHRESLLRLVRCEGKNDIYPLLLTLMIICA